MPRTDPRMERAALLAAIVLVCLLVAGIAANLLSPAPETVVAAVAVLGLMHSTVGWLTHGGQRVSMPGVYMLGTGLFVFFPALYLSQNPILGPLPYLPAAVNVCYFGQIAMYHLWWKPTEDVTPQTITAADPGAYRRAMWTGVALVAVGLAAGLVGITHMLLDAAAFSGTVLYAVTAFRRPKPTMPDAYVTVASMFVAYYLFIFDGFGRLTLGALGVAIIAAMAHRWPGRTVKLVLVAALAPALAFLARIRAEWTATLNPLQSADVTGLESVIWPVGRFAQLIARDQAGLLDYANGGTFWASAVVWVPRELWEGKPIGLGSELTSIFNPHLASVGHSEAATSYGEWLYNFGSWGLLFMVPVIAIAVGFVDRKLVSVQARPVLRGREFVVLAGLVIVTAGMVDLVWGSSFTFASRGATRLLVLVAIYATVAWLPSKRRAGASAGSSAASRSLSSAQRTRSPRLGSAGRRRCR